MSHTTTIDSIVISDVAALKAAVKDMQKAGISCHLAENKIPRAYSRGQKGMDTAAEYVLELPKCSYDVGLYYSKELGGYEARTDFYDPGITQTLGVDRAKNGKGDQHRLGKLFQAYGVCATERQARNQGYMVTRSTQQDGTVQLRLSA